MTAAAVDAPSAGAQLDQIAIATGFASVTTGVLLWLVLGHARGTSSVLERAGARSRRLLGLEPWAALPLLICTVGLTAGGFGVFWDIGLHIEAGRDTGPLANPSHYPILFALYSIFAGGVCSIALHRTAKRPSPRAITLPGGISAPVGGALMLLAGAFALSGFPMDDAWHRMFGQDVTLWGPTHLVMINGAILTVPIQIVLMLEAKRAAGIPLGGKAKGLGDQLTRAFMPGALLFAIAFWATEFDYGVPQYRGVWHPLLLALAAGVALTAGRLWLGRGGALVVAGVYVALRLSMTVFVEVLGLNGPAMPVFVVEALVIEAVLWAGVAKRGGVVRTGLLAGLAVGTVGFAANYAWTHLGGSPYPWTPGILAEGLPTAIVAGLAGGTLGALLGGGLSGRLPGPQVRRRAGWAAVAATVALGANALVATDGDGLRAQVALQGAGDGRAFVVADLADPDAPDGATWFRAMAWQGDGVIVTGMERQADGTWRSAQAIPVGGTWKAALRLHEGRALSAITLHLPRDPGIGTPGLDRPASFTAAFANEREFLQTERRDYVPGWLWTPAALLMLLACGCFVTAIAYGIVRITNEDDAQAGGGPDSSSTGSPASTMVAQRTAKSSSASRIPASVPNCKPIWEA